MTSDHIMNYIIWGKDKNKWPPQTRFNKGNNVIPESYEDIDLSADNFYSKNKINGDNQPK